MAEHKTEVHDPALEALLEQKRQLAGADAVLLPRNTNQALGIAKFCSDFMSGSLGSGPAESVYRRVELFHTDSVVCGISALALGCNAPTILRDEAHDYPNPNGALCFGSKQRVAAEKAVCANASAVREWDSNGTVFGYNKKLGHLAGEFGHNDYYPAVIAACQIKGYDGQTAAQAMILLDEIRGRLAEVFSLKSYKIDHVVHGAIATAAVYGTLMGASHEQIESAMGMVVAHYIPWRAIRAGHQLSDSKGASAALSSEVAILSVHRAMRGFVGPKDIFRNPESFFRYFQKTQHDYAPFDLVLSHSGEDFAVMGMHVKLGLYEHQSAGALQGIIDVVRNHPNLLSADQIASIRIVAYEPAFGIIGDPAKRDPHTRQSADHSMVYIVSTLLRKAISLGAALSSENDTAWKQLLLTPYDYSHEAIFHPETRALMQKISFAHGGQEYDDKYPDGIPTSVVITDQEGKEYDSGFVMYPAGHARNTVANLDDIVSNKFAILGAIAVSNPESMIAQLSNLRSKSAAEIAQLYDFDIQYKAKIDA
eukprot:TRINITY_DN1407_c0_g1_i1.p1 TRINITY_DN1407_c0_g1~~TRINITY_DN1407_c0_g1_i1.p1  ORF type:complete len:537 (+),score=189.65 TRINITY_DN1407_c0_g1_i1:2-1612(+)